MKGGYANIDDGGFAGDVYTALTGKDRNDPVSTTGLSDIDIYTAVNNARGMGKQVTFGTKNTQPADSPVHGDHAYVVIGYVPYDTNNDGVNDTYAYKLYNPWGTEAPALLPIELLNETLSSYEILEGL